MIDTYIAIVSHLNPSLMFRGMSKSLALKVALNNVVSKAMVADNGLG